MNLNELQAFLEECNWDDDPMPAQVTDSLKSLGQQGGDGKVNFEEIELSSERRPASAKVRAQTVELDAGPGSEVMPGAVSEFVSGEFSLAREAEQSSAQPTVPEVADELQAEVQAQVQEARVPPAPAEAMQPQVSVEAAVTPLVAPVASVAPRSSAAVKLVPRPAVSDEDESAEGPAGRSLRERLAEVEMAQRMGYLLCKCTWPPQIMVLTGTDHVYRCRRCSRVREM